MSITLQRRWSRLAPIASAAALAVMWGVGGYSRAPSPQTQEYLADVARVIEALPYKVGDWIGADVAVQPAAVRLLNPNKLLQRRYRNPSTGGTVQVLIVHCGDTRDMVGHYPPICYPAQGWVQERSERVEVRINQTPTAATAYRFKRSLDDIETAMVVTNFFILPGVAPPTAPDIGALNTASQSLAMSALGAAQVQIVTEPSLTEKERAEIVDAFVAALEPIILAITQERRIAQ